MVGEVMLDYSTNWHEKSEDMQQEAIEVGGFGLRWSELWLIFTAQEAMAKFTIEKVGLLRSGTSDADIDKDIAQHIKREVRT